MKSSAMTVAIVAQVLRLNLYGFSGTAVNENYAETAFILSGRMWQIIKEKNIVNNGKNIWVYDRNHEVFAGLTLEENPGIDTGLERKVITLNKYAYLKHTGPYNQLATVAQSLNYELKEQGLVRDFPYIEIYGHWTADESRLETDLYFSLR